MPTIRSATTADLPAAGRSLARAFADDPVWLHITAAGPDWEDRAARWFATECGAQLAGHGEVLVDDDVRGVALWSPPDHWKPGLRDAVVMLRPSLSLMRTRLGRSMRVQATVAKHHPTDPPHWYLALLGTDPNHQGTGVGSALLTTITDRCDEQGLPAYLESSKEQNISFYARHGFEVQERLELPGGPPIWRMWRETRG